MDQKIIDLLHDAQEIAVVGISDKPERDSHVVAAFLQNLGYSIVPINPRLTEVLGETCYPTLAAYGKPVDIVDIFRKPEAVPDIAEEAAATGAKALWMQEGISHPDAARKAQEAGLLVVQDQCIKKVLASLGGRP